MCFDAPQIQRVVFEWPSPTDKQNQTNIFQVTWLLNPPLSPYLCALPNFVPPPTHPSHSKLHKPSGHNANPLFLTFYPNTHRQPCICTDANTCKSTEVARCNTHAHTETETPTHHRVWSGVMRAVTCPEAEVCFFSPVLFWQSNEQPVGISQEFLSDIKLWLMPCHVAWT